MNALITGASSGIGRALAVEFARSGYGLLLVARDLPRLQAVATECRERFGVEVEIFPQDVGAPDSTLRVGHWIRSLRKPINVLVNNAGFGVHGDFAFTDLDREIEMVNTHITAMLGLSKLVLPEMIGRGAGGIINICSLYSFLPAPQQAVYAATKGFMLSFSEALSDELKWSGLTVTAVCPGTVNTEFRTRMGVYSKKPSGMSPERVARTAVHAFQAEKSLCIPGFLNQLLALLAKFLPRSVVPGLVRVANRMRRLNAGAKPRQS